MLRKKEIPCACNYIPNNIQTKPLFTLNNINRILENCIFSLLQYSWVMHIYEGLQATHANNYSMLQIRGLIQSLLHSNITKGSQWWKARFPQQEQAINWILQPLLKRNIFLKTVTPFTCFTAEHWQLCEIKDYELL